MNFGELKFWAILGSCIGVSLGLRQLLRPFLGERIVRFDRLALLLTGWVLLLSVGALTFGIYLWVALVTYFGLAALIRQPASVQRRLFWVLLPLQIGPLCFFKYADFVANGVLHLGVSQLAGLLIPAGISFYTFQKVSFTIDTLVRSQPLPRFLDYLNFAGFFPQVVAGPIERKADLLPQMEQFRFRWDRAGMEEGTGWVVLGLFLKLTLADNLATVFHRESATNAYAIWFANLLFGLRIYFDFAGYSLVALGLARWLGVRLTLNFRSPYTAPNIAEFWRRWHITLSQWFRDYVYIPLGGGRTRYWMLTVLTVFIVSGIWHGAGWNFILWGALHGSFLVVYRWLARAAVPTWLGRVVTLGAVCFAWLPFYETRPAVLFTKLMTLVRPSAYSLPHLREFIRAQDPSDALVIAGIGLLSLGVFLAEQRSLRGEGEPYSVLRRPLALVAMVFLTVWLAPANNNAFIYFAF